jgi:hypothetical protein
VSRTAATMGEPLRDMAVTTGSQQGEVAAAAATPQVSVPRAPS